MLTSVMRFPAALMRAGYVTKIVFPAAAGFGLDLLAGDPSWIYHPVRLIGKLIEVTEGKLRRLFPKTPAGEKTAGGVFAILVCAVVTAASAVLVKGADLAGPVTGIVVRTVLCWLLFAARSLRDESMKVHKALLTGNLAEARKAVSMIVGRDTQNLDEAGVIKAAVETVAENTSDGVIAPMFYLMLGGPAAGWFYKAVNTMDSMTGYRNETYLHFGFFPAKLDDLANLIPARLSALFMICASLLLRLDAGNAVRIFLRDRYKHASPNSAQTEAVMAGALGVQLAGDAFYFGKLYHKPTIGDDMRPVETEDITRANRLMYMTSLISMAVFVLLRAVIG